MSVSVLGLQAAGTGAVGALAAPLEKAFDVGNTQIGLLVTATTLIGCIATLPFGTFADRYSRTLLLQVTVALWAVATVVSPPRNEADPSSPLPPRPGPELLR